MSLPELPADTSSGVTLTGHVRIVHGRPLIVLPYAAPIGISRGRRFRIEPGHGPAVSRVMFSLGGQAALRPVDASPLIEDQPVVLRVRALPSRRPRRIPVDLSRALAEAGTTLDHLDEPAAQHLLLMVTETLVPAVRAQRVHAAVEAARKAGESKS